MKTVPADKVLYSTIGQDVLCSRDQDVDYLTPSTHEKADTCIILHDYDAASKQSDKILIHTIDTEVVVLTVANVFKL